MLENMSIMEDLLLLALTPTTLLGILIILFVFCLLYSSSNPQRKEPPGPRPLPLVGNLLQLDLKAPHISLHELSKKYGSVFTVHLGLEKMVVMAGYKTIKQALLSPDALGERDISPIINELKLAQGIVFNNGESWKEMRHFALTNLKDFGMGRKACEEKIIEESQILIDLIKDKKGTAFDTSLPITHAVSNIICSMLYGKRFEYDDPEFRSMVHRICSNNKLMGSASVQLYNRYPRLFNWLGSLKELRKNVLLNRTAFTRMIKGLQDTLNSQMCRGVVDAFLTRKIQHESSKGAESHYHTDNLLATVMNLFGAGTDTSSSTLRFGLLFMAKYPKIQDKVQEELDSVVGSRQMRAEDRKSLPYTDAVICEIQRMANIVPSLQRQAKRDVIFQDHFIKKGSNLFLLLSSVHRDEDEWETPYTFNPAHFLDKEGLFRKRDAFLPFSAGSRVCVGESLARMELFLFFTSLLQNFRFTPPPGVTEDDLDLIPVAGITFSPPPHHLCAVSRV